MPIVMAGQTLATGKTAGGRPSDANPLPHLEAVDVFSERDHRADRFMSGHERELGHAPFVVEHRKIGMADAAVRDFDFHLVLSQLARIKFKRLQWTFGGLRRVSMNS
jgi:hypothetical protein